MRGSKSAHMAASKRRAEVSDLYLRGHSTRAVAAQVGVSQQQVVRDLAIISREWQEQRLENRSAYIAAELQRLAQVESAAWDGFERSQAVLRRKEVEKSESPVSAEQAEGDEEATVNVRRRQRLVEEERDGSVVWLSAVLSVVAQRRALLGLDSPAKHEINVSADPFATLSDRESGEWQDRIGRSKDRLVALEGGAHG